MSKKFLQLAMKESKGSGFSKYLASPITNSGEELKNTMSFGYVVPPNLCKQQGKTARLTVSAMMAIFDEVSTYGLIRRDKTSRGGVSVHLSGEVVQAPAANEKVTLFAMTDKVGKALGFCSIEIRNEKGDILARGKHIKYMPLGWVWDILAQPWMLPITIALYNFFAKAFPRKPVVIPDCPDVNGVFSELNVRTCVDDSTQLAIRDSKSADTFRFELSGKKHFNNIMGKMHGGAVAMAIEEACLQAKAAENKDHKLFVESLDARYLAPMGGELIITCKHDPTKKHLSTGYVCSKKTGLPCVEYTCHWGRAEQK